MTANDNSTAPYRSGVIVPVTHSLARHLIFGAIIVVVLVIGVGGMAGQMTISGAIIAPGSLVVETNVKKVQHPIGGVVGEIRVRQGQVVKAGDVLLRLDETVTRAQVAMIVRSLAEIDVGRARLEAERDDAVNVTFGAFTAAKTTTELLSPADIDTLRSGEVKLFEIRREARTGQVAQLRNRIAQLVEEQNGLEIVMGARVRELQLIETELQGARELWSRSLIPIARLTALERESTRLEGDRGQLAATIAQTRGRIAEVELQIVQIGRDLASEVGRELRELEARRGGLIERLIAADDQLRRIDVRAPRDGVVHELEVHTVGGVIRAGETIMSIVPKADALIVQARVSPNDIDQLKLGQTALMRFTGLDRGTTPEIAGRLTRISADITTDPRSGDIFYDVRVTLPNMDERSGNLSLVPGMPVEIFLQTGERQILTWLLKPITDQLARALRER